MITVKSFGTDLPLEKHLRNGESRNKDGIGIALLKADKTEIFIKKDFKEVNEFIKWFYDNVKKEDACIVHFRYATHGLKDNGNRHPFPITKNKELLRKEELVCKMVVAHNGVISSYGQHIKYSDTQKFILDILSDDVVKDNIGNTTVQKLIENFLGGDRLVIMSSEGALYYWGKWYKEGDIYYSNDGYEEEKIVVKYDDWYNKLYQKQDDDGYFELCDGCGENKYVKMVTIKEECLLLCKACRKKHAKGKLQVSFGTKVDKGTFKDNLLALENKIQGKFTELEKISLSETQCESCLEWKEKTEMNKYYRHDICTSCLDDILYHSGEVRNEK
jgi:hypothetical protein